MEFIDAFTMTFEEGLKHTSETEAEIISAFVHSFLLVLFTRHTYDDKYVEVLQRWISNEIKDVYETVNNKREEMKRGELN